MHMQRTILALRRQERVLVVFFLLKQAESIQHRRDGDRCDGVLCSASLGKCHRDESKGVTPRIAYRTAVDPIPQARTQQLLQH